MFRPSGTARSSRRFDGLFPECSPVFPYFCIVNTPGRPNHEICIVPGPDDASARSGLADLARRWPGFETIELYQGERVVAILANVGLGFPDAPIAGLDEQLVFANAA